jgi:glycosyltransferase involved in cell wall biosynthesis
MHILIGMTYYRPHTSGMTIYAERLAGAFVRRGHEVTVLTSQFNRQLPAREDKNGITLIRIPPLMRISKGLLMPAMPFEAWRRICQADVVNLHMPQLDAAYMAWFSKLMHKPVILTYQCDLRLPRGLINVIANQVSDLASHVAGWGSDAIVSITQDYAEHSAYLTHYMNKVHVLDAPVELALASEADISAFRDKFGIKKGQRIIGMAGRLATEKGVEYVLQALPQVLEQIPQARLLFVGSYQNVVGEEGYAARILPLIEGLEDHWSFLGHLSEVEMTAFFKTCELLLMPSLNSTEAFGLVQIEAMSCGTPVVATDLPGVRVPVKSSGMGRIVPVADAAAISRAILDILAEPERYRGNADEIKHKYSPDVIAAGYEKMFEALGKEYHGGA